MRLATYAIFSLLISSSLFAHPIGNVLCAQKPNLAALELAIFQDRNPGFVNKNGESYLHIAAKRNLGKAIAPLMKLPQIQALFWAQNGRKQTALEVAIAGNKESAFRALLPFMGDPNRFRVDNKHRWTHLHLTAYYDRDKMALALIEAGHIVNPVDKTGWSPLDTAFYKDAKQTQRVLLANGARSTMPEEARVRLMAAGRAEGAAIFPQQPDPPDIDDEESDDLLGAPFLFQPELRIVAGLCATAGAAALFPKLCTLL